MKKISTNIISSGMRLAQPVYNSDGVALVQEGCTLDQITIARLKDYGVSDVYIAEEELNNEQFLDIISRQARAEAIKTLKDWIFNTKEHCLVKTNTNTDINRLIDRLLDELRRNRDCCVQFLDIKTIDTHTYDHCVNVALLSLITGLSLGYNDQELQILGMAALLHDVGKSMLPREIVTKNGEYNDYEMEWMRKHPEYGFKLTFEDEDLNPIISEIIYQHHERFDGSGYPRGLKKEQILQAAYILGVADVYEALTSNRSYRKKYLPHEAVEYLYGAGNRLFDFIVIEAFVKHVALYPIGTSVLLNNGEEGIVVDIDPKLSSRPMVMVTKKRNGKRPMTKKVWNLKDTPTIIITKVLETER